MLAPYRPRDAHFVERPRQGRYRHLFLTALLSVPSVIDHSPALARAQTAAQPVVRAVELRLAGRQTVIDLYEPLAVSHDAVVLVHGFTRTRQTMSEHARQLVTLGVLAVAPQMPFFFDSRDNARALRDLIASLRRGDYAPPVTRIVLVGFSAGGLAALLAADAPGVVGYLGLDPFDRPSRIGLDTARRLQTPTELLRAPSSACNAFSIAAPWSTALPRLVADRVLPAASHCDFEAPTDWICRTLCGRPDAARQAVVSEVLRNAARRWLLEGTAATTGPQRTIED